MTATDIHNVFKAQLSQAKWETYVRSFWKVPAWNPRFTDSMVKLDVAVTKSTKPEQPLVTDWYTKQDQVLYTEKL